MTDVQKEEGQKTIVAFIVGLLIGGLLVWVFIGGEKAEAPSDINVAAPATTTTTTTQENNTKSVDEPVVESETAAPSATLTVGEGAVVVENQAPSSRIAMKSATYPVGEGWIGVRDYVNGNLGGILGVVRFSKSQGLVPSEIILQRPTKAGNTYAVVIFTEDGDRQFNSAGDVQIDKIFTTFKAE